MNRTIPILIAACMLPACGPGPANTPKTETSAAPSSQAANAGGQGAAADFGIQAHGTHHHRKHRGGGAQTAGGAEAGKFDFYVMSLSWSPGFCATPAGSNDDLQCGPERHFAFVLHGLWPQYESNGWPENCGTGEVDDATVQKMLPIMPSPQLIRHEWQKHGTCSGLDSRQYFDEATEAFQEVKIPAKYQAPKSAITIAPAQLQADFGAANPSFGNDGFVVLCSGNGRYLQEVRACITQELHGRACPASVAKDQCKSDSVIMRPLR